MFAYKSDSVCFPLTLEFFSGHFLLFVFAIDIYPYAKFDKTEESQYNEEFTELGKMKTDGFSVIWSSLSNYVECEKACLRT